jgi:hypothetical protein
MFMSLITFLYCTIINGLSQLSPSTVNFVLSQRWIKGRRNFDDTNIIDLAACRIPATDFEQDLYSTRIQFFFHICLTIILLIPVAVRC